ncbi:MAG: hypothetical protein AAFO99_15190 [Bacteroidota bacterium]
MKKQLIYIALGLSSGLFAQIPANNKNAMTSSVAMSATLDPFVRVIEPDLRASVDKYKDFYVKRLYAYVPTAIDAGAILSEIEKLELRANKVKVDNNNLAFFYPFKKKDNLKKINAILGLLDKLYKKLSHLKGFGSFPDLSDIQNANDITDLNNLLSAVRPTIYGERINLNQNTEISLEVLSRKLDEIEADIHRSTLLRKFFPY